MLISKTPLRISFAGGGTDFPDYYQKGGGSVISTTIDKYIYVIVNPSFSNRIHVSYSKKETCGTAGEVQHELVRECLKQVGIDSKIEVTTMADIPSEGTGLGSSSALTVGLLNAFYRYNGKDVSREQLAAEACEIEMNVLGKPIGKQDQYICALGGLRLTQFLKNGTVISELLRTNPMKRRMIGQELMLFYTGVARKSGDILLEQKQNIDLNQELLDAIRDGVMPMKAALLESRSMIGYHLHMNWVMKRELARTISNRALDDLYARALGAGATGGKITGAGGGGFLLLHCPVNRQEDVRTALLPTQDNNPDDFNGVSELLFELEDKGTHIVLED